MQFILYNKDTFEKDIEGIKKLAIVNIRTRHYDGKTIIMEWGKDSVHIRLYELEKVTIYNNKIVLETNTDKIEFDHIDVVDNIDDKIYRVIANVWGLIIKLLGDD